MAPGSRALSFAVLLALAVPCRSQLTELRDRHFDAAVHQVRLLVDLDADGDLDLVGLPQQSHPLLLHENLGQLRFRDAGATALPPVVLGTDVQVADLTGDGRPEIIGASSGVLRLLVRIGSLYREEPARLPPGLPSVWNVRVGDVDRDGDLDLLAVSTDLRVLRNDGTGRFTLDPQVGPRLVGARSVVADLTGDGAGEVVVFDFQGVRVLVNDGQGAFALGTTVVLPNTIDVAAFDADRDGDVDIVAATITGPDRLVLYANDGTGALVPVPGALPSPRSEVVHQVVAVDVDRDGDHDLAVAAPEFATEILLNNGGVFLRPAARLLPTWPEVRALAMGDVDGDGDADLVMRPEGTADAVLCLNENGRFSPLNPPDVVPGARATADLDGDGAADVIGLHGSTNAFTGHALHFLSVSHNDGAGRASVQGYLRLPGAPSSVMTGDTDADGDVDALVLTAEGNFLANLLVLANDGRGNLTVVLTQPVYGSANAPPRPVLDLDRDGDVDIVWSDGPNGVVLENRGAGGFVPHALPGFVAPGLSAATFDLERDGLPDLLVCDVTGLRLYSNRGGMNFVDATALIVNSLDGTYLAAASSANGVTGPVLWSLSRIAPQTVRQHRFDGARFVPYGDVVLTGSGSVTALRTVDFDGTGGQLVLSSPVRSQSYNVGLFETTANVLASGATGQLQVLDDVDGDGDVDALWTSGTEMRLLRWAALQLHAPLGAHRGYEYRLDLRIADSPVLFLGVTPARIATPFGVLRLDPSSALAIPVGLTRSLQFTLPDLPALVGLPLLAQAFGRSGGNAYRLTNLEARRIH